MDKILEFFQNNPWLNAISILLALVGLVLTVYYALKGKKEKVPRYSSSTYNLFSETHSTINDLDIKYKGQTLNELNITKFGFWNAGKETIDGSDIAPSSPLFIVPNDGQILKVDLIHQLNSSNNFKVSLNENLIQINFDYIDQNEGVVIQIFHEQECKFSLTGDLKGVKEIKSINPRNPVVGVFKPIKKLKLDLRSSYNRRIKIFFFLIFPLTPVIIDPFKYIEFGSIDKVLTTIFYSFTILLYWMFAYYYYKRKIPVGIDKELNKKTAYNNG